MIGHILQTARDSDLFKVIHVSTEDEEIIEIANRLGFQIDFPRIPELADDLTPIMPVLKWVTQTYIDKGKTFDEIWLLMACAPLITAMDLNLAADLFSSQNESSSVMAVTPYPVPVEWAYSLDASGNLDPREPGKFAVRSQDLGKYYYDSGAFYFYYAKQVLQESFSGGGKMRPFFLPRHRAIDIDEMEDLKYAEIIYRGLR